MVEIRLARRRFQLQGGSKPLLHLLPQLCVQRTARSRFATRTRWINRVLAVHEQRPGDTLFVYSREGRPENRARPAGRSRNAMSIYLKNLGNRDKQKRRSQTLIGVDQPLILMAYWIEEDIRRKKMSPFFLCLRVPR